MLPLTLFTFGSWCCRYGRCSDLSFIIRLFDQFGNIFLAWVKIWFLILVSEYITVRVTSRNTLFLWAISRFLLLLYRLLAHGREWLRPWPFICRQDRLVKCVLTDLEEFIDHRDGADNELVEVCYRPGQHGISRLHHHDESAALSWSNIVPSLL